MSLLTFLLQHVELAFEKAQSLLLSKSFPFQLPSIFGRLWGYRCLNTAVIVYLESGNILLRFSRAFGAELVASDSVDVLAT